MVKLIIACGVCILSIQYAPTAKEFDKYECMMCQWGNSSIFNAFMKNWIAQEDLWWAWLHTKVGMALSIWACHAIYLQSITRTSPCYRDIPQSTEKASDEWTADHVLYIKKPRGNVMESSWPSLHDETSYYSKLSTLYYLNVKIYRTFIFDMIEQKTSNFDFHVSY